MSLNKDQRKKFDTICERMGGGKSLRRICEADDNLPSRETIRRWLRDDNDGELCGQYARAAVARVHYYAEEIVDISDDAQNDYMEGLGPDGQSVGWKVNGEHIQRSKLRIDARKWIASKLDPKVYGDKLALGGAADLPPIRQEVAEKADAFTDTLAGLARRADAEKATRH